MLALTENHKKINTFSYKSKYWIKCKLLSRRIQTLSGTTTTEKSNAKIESTPTNTEKVLLYCEKIERFPFSYRIKLE